MMDTQHLRGKRGNTNVKHEARDAGVWKKGVLYLNKRQLETHQGSVHLIQV